MFKNWRTNKVYVIIMLIVIFLMPIPLAQDNVYSTHLICVGLGIDKLDQGYEVSVQVVVPEEVSLFKQKLQVYSARGNNMQDCVANLSSHLGKELGLAHCSHVVVNKEVLDGYLIENLDFFMRSYQIDFNCAVCATDKTAKDILLLSGELNNNQGFDITTMLDYNNAFLFSRNANIQTVYSSLMSGSNSYFLKLFTTTSDSSSGVNAKGEVGADSEGGEQGGGGSAGGEQKKDASLVNSDTVLFMQKSELIGSASVQELEGVRYINPQNTNFELVIDNFTDDFYFDATVYLSSDKKFQTNRYYFVDGVPTVQLNIIQYLKIDAIEQDHYNKSLFLADVDNFTYALELAVKNHIIEKINQGISVLKTYNCDGVNVYDGFKKYANKQFLNFLHSLEDPDKYFDKINFVIDVKVEHE